jgi:23S rRNA (uracil1939-C5)-methyltransferase
MKKSNSVRFSIKSLDASGQGFSNLDGNLVFVPKTLPGETGVASIIASKKKVSFAKLDQLDQESELRAQPECPHYNNCGGCSYLHMSYQDEINFKTLALKDIFDRQHKIKLQNEIIVHAAKTRSHYRNRVQLHYNKNSLGFFGDGQNKDIIDVSNCLLMKNEVAAKVKALYQDDHWKTLNLNKKEGHIEVYLRDGKVSIHINQRYSNEGFTQVNQEMNEELKSLIDNRLNELGPDDYVIDLFGGSGNLSKKTNSPTLVIDSTPTKYIELTNDHQEYLELDLYGKHATRDLQNKIKRSPDLLIIDPPRSGLKNLDEYLKIIQPKEIIYVSCNAQTLARDLKKVENEFVINELFLFDFFPSTKHFETVVTLSKS